MLLDERQLSLALQSYANGHLTERALCDVSGLCFEDVLNEMGKRGLKLPKVDTTAGYNDNQLRIYNAIFGTK